MMFFVGEALAEGGSAATQSSNWVSFLPMVAFIAILYFLLIRPQQKRAKQHQALISSIKKGDKVITNSGIIATVSKVLNDQEVVLEIADGVHCRFVKSAIASVGDGSGKSCETASSCCTTTQKTNVSKNGSSPVSTKEEKPISKKSESDNTTEG